MAITCSAAPFLVGEANVVQIAFIDAGVAGWETLRDALPSGIDAILVDADADGVAVLCASLAARRGVAAIHVLSHGFAGGFMLGTARVDRASLAERADAWQAIGDSLAVDGDILLYSCLVASGAGEAFLDDLAEITGANLAASRTLTGAAARGGDWGLGWMRGAVTTPVLQLTGFPGVLALLTYSSAVGYIAENTFTMAFDGPLDGANPPPPGAFSVQINGTGVTTTGVAVDGAGGKVTLTLSGNSLTAGDIIECSYSDPTGGNDAKAIQDLGGNDVATFNASTIVFGGRPITPVAFVSGEANGQFVTLTYDGPLASLPTAGTLDFLILVDGVVVTVNSLLVDGPAGTVTFTLREPVAPGLSVEFLYTDPTGDNDTYAVQGPNGTDAASVGLRSIANVTLAPTVDTPPVATANAINPSLSDDVASTTAVFKAVTVDTVDSGQAITEMVLKVHNVGATSEYLTIGASDIQLATPGSGSGAGFDYSVAVANGVATVTLTNMLATPADAASFIEAIQYKTGDGSNAPAGSSAVRPVVLQAITDSGAAGSNTTEVNLVSTVTLTDVAGGVANYALTATPVDPTLSFTAGTPTQVEFLVTATTSLVLIGSTVSLIPSLPPGWSYTNLTFEQVDRTSLAESPGAFLTGIIAAGTLYKLSFDVVGSGTDASGAFPVSLTTVSSGLSYKFGLSSSSTMMTLAVLDEVPTLAATGLAPSFIGGQVAEVALFDAVTASVVDAGQVITGLTLTVTNVLDAGEYLVIGATDVALSDGATTVLLGFGPAGGNASASVSVFGGTATVTITSLGLVDAAAAGLIEGIGYKNLTPSSSIGDRVISITQLTDDGTNNAASIKGVSATVTVEDLTSPDAPLVTSAGLTNDTTPVIGGTAEAGATITLTIGGATYTTVATGGVWSVDLGSATPATGVLALNANGENAYDVTATDPSSNTSVATTRTLVVDATPPAAPAIVSTVLTNDATPVISGTAEDGATISLSIAGASYTVVAAGGVWSVDLGTATPTSGTLALDTNGQNRGGWPNSDSSISGESA